MDRKCPLCREEIPPSREMIAQLKTLKNHKSRLEAKGDIFSQQYMWTKSQIERWEREFGGWTETLDHSDDKKEMLSP